MFLSRCGTPIRQHDRIDKNKTVDFVELSPDDVLLLPQRTYSSILNSTVLQPIHRATLMYD
jgi:hypothetical protein